MDSRKLSRVSPKLPTIEGAIENGRASWIERLGTTELKGDERTASMSIGNLFRSELILG
jgi:hypothetical protein